MKNATKHADELRLLYKRMLKQCQAAQKTVLDPLQALVRGAMSFDVTDAKAEEAMRMIDREFVDLNELRVATDLEIAELLGTRYPAIERRVAMITQSLNNIFEREHTMSLDRLKTISRRDARQFLRELPEIHPFVEAYVMLFAFDGHAVPIDEMTVTFLKEQEMLEESASMDDAQRFVEHQFKAEECHELYVVLRKAVADDKERSRKK